MHILVISPVVPSEGHTLVDATLDGLAPPDVRLSHVALEEGPQSIEYRYEEAMLVPDMVRKAMAAERAGVDGIFVDCMADPGVEVLRECMSVPVIGPGRLSMQMATLLGRRFSILVELDIVGRLFVEEVRQYGLADRFTGCRSIDVPVLELLADPAHTTALLVDAAERAIREDGADTFVLGCTVFSTLTEGIIAGLAAREISVPVLNPRLVAINTLAGLIRSGLSHSKVAFPFPAGKRVIGFNMPGF